MKNIEHIAVIGAGTMGHGIAEVFATHGYPVQVYEPDARVVERARNAIEEELTLLAEMGRIDAREIPQIMDRIVFHQELADAVAHSEFVIEAIPEDLALKQALFAKLDALCRDDAILASNTSSLRLAAMLETVKPARVAQCLVCHWYNPAHLIPLVELSDFGNRAPQVLERVEALFERVGKKTIRVRKDIPGLIANRIQQAIAREVFALIEQDAASPEDIDKALKFGPAFRYATTGQLEIADFGGIDIWCTVGDNLLPSISAARESSALLREKIAQNKLGLKTGEGFFVYDPAQRQRVTRDFHTRLIRQLAVSEQNQ